MPLISRHTFLTLSLGAFLALVGCSMKPPVLEGEHLPTPPPPTTSFEAPTPKLNVVAPLRDHIRAADLPREPNGKIELPFNHFYYSYSPGFATVELTPGLIRARIPYNYRWQHFRERIYWCGFFKFCSEWKLVKEESGSASVGFDTTYRWTPDWNFEFRTTAIAPPGKLAEFLLKKKLDEIAGNVNTELSKHANLRPRFEEVWKAAWTPIRLPEDATLLINPLDLWVSAFRTTEVAIASGLGFSAKPAVAFGSPPAPAVPPLPELRVRERGEPDVVVAMTGRVKFETAESLLRDRVKAMEFPTKLGKVKLKDVDVYGLNKTVVVGVLVDHWLLKGWVYLSGDLEYRQLNYTLNARNLRLDIQTSNPFIRVFAWFFTGQFEEALGPQAYWPTLGASREAMESLEKEFNAALKGQLRLQMISIRPVTSGDRQVLFTDDGGFNVALVGRGKFVEPE